MKIALNMSELSSGNDKNSENQALERVILATKAGDFEARDALYHLYLPLLTSLAKKRTADDVGKINELIEKGKSGLLTAAKKYKTSVGPDKFKLFALDYIEKEMDSGNSKGGLLSRLFGAD